MNAMSDAFKKARMAKHKPMAEGSPMEEKSESRKDEAKEQAKGHGDRAPVVKDNAGMVDAPMAIHGDQQAQMDPSLLHDLLKKLLAGQAHPGPAVPHGTSKNFEQMGMDHVKGKVK